MEQNYNISDEQMEMICAIFEYQYFEAFKKRHLTEYSLDDCYIIAFPEKWDGLTFQAKIEFLKNAINDDRDLDSYRELWPLIR